MLPRAWRRGCTTVAHLCQHTRPARGRQARSRCEALTQADEDPPRRLLFTEKSQSFRTIHQIHAVREIELDEHSKYINHGRDDTLPIGHRTTPSNTKSHLQANQSHTHQAPPETPCPHTTLRSAPHTPPGPESHLSAELYAVNPPPG